MRSALALLLVAGLALAWGCPAESDSRGSPRRLTVDAAARERAHLEFLRSADELRPVRQDVALLAGRWRSWVYMPWRYQWTIGTEEAGGRFARDHGITGAVLDHGWGPVEWVERFDLGFYNDHTAGKGVLWLYPDRHPYDRRDARAVRGGSRKPMPLDAAQLDGLRETLDERIARLRRSPQRLAYALDDEPSWGILARPVPWRVNGDDAAYAAWLAQAYGVAPPPARFVSPDDVLPELEQPLAEIDLSPLVDRLAYNDSVWANFLGALVEHCNTRDDETPCGVVGTGTPGAWGGHDYAKLMRKLQFIEAYELGGAPEVVRSLKPAALPQVTTHFRNDELGSANDRWLAWHYLAHGHRGVVGWVEGWFDGKEPQPWLAEVAPTWRELSGRVGELVVGRRFLDDGICLLYSHPSVQVGWLLDAQAHGKTWPNRNDDERLGTSHLVRRAWQFLLEDAGLQYRYVAADLLARDGVPADCRVLVLPAAFALSDLAARRLREHATGGGTVVADFMAGLFDHHGTGRPHGLLDDLFGVAHDGTEMADDFFAGGTLWVETDQDRGFSYRTYDELFATLEPRLHRGYAVAERALPADGVRRRVGQGGAVLLNLSPQRYLMLREEGRADVAARAPFLEPILAAGVRPALRVVAPPDAPPLELTRFDAGEREIAFVTQNAEITGTGRKGGARRLRTGRLTVVLELPRAVALRDERAGRELGTASRFELPLVLDEAIVVSWPR